MTQVRLDGVAPAWVGSLTDDLLRRRLGPGTFERGAVYADQGAVSALTSGNRAQLLLATVRGSGRSTYQTLVTLDLDTPHEPSFSGRCSCPMQVDCKHVAAVLLTARERWGRPLQPAWQVLLNDLVRPAPTPVTAAGLGLLVEPVTRTPTRYADSPEPLTRLRLLPVTPGKNGWIKTGVSWRDLELGHQRVPVQPDQREALLGLLSRFRSAQPPWASPWSAVQVHLDDLGRGGWRLLDDAQRAGIALVAGARGATRTVHLVGAPASVVLDVRRSERDGARLGAVVRVPGEPDLAPGRARLVGQPAHGMYLEDGDRLLLARFDPPLAPAVSALLDVDVLEVPAAELSDFLSGYYPVLRQRVTVESGDGSISLPEVIPPRLAVTVGFEAGHRTVIGWGFAYTVGDQVLRTPIAAEPGRVARDPDAEDALLGTLGFLDVVPGLRVDVGPVRRPVPRTVLTGLDTAAFVEHVLPVLRERDDVLVDVEGVPVDYVEHHELPRITVSATDSTDPDHTDWFDLGVRVFVADQDVPLALLLAALTRGDEHLLLDSGTWFTLDRPELASLRALLTEARSLQDRPGEALRITPWQAGLWDELVTLGVVDQQSERWTRTVSALLDLEAVPQPDPPAGLQARLRPYQLEGYHWLCLLWDHRLGGILADDMGLGKTLQTLAMAARAHEQGDLGDPLLIVAPTSVVSTWASEAAKFVPHLRVVTVTETARRSGRSLVELVDGAQVVVTSYALLRIDEDAYRSLRWSGLVLDEAQFVKNHQAKTYQCARRLPAPFKLGITGTPLENSLMDLWSLLSITAPGLFPNPQRFTDAYRKPIESGESPEQLATLRRRIRPWMLRRTKEAVAADLPPKVEQTLEITLNPAHRRVYDKHLQRERQRVLGLIEDLNRNRIAILRSLTVLRQLSLDASLVDAAHAGTIASSKIDALMEQLVEVVAEGHRVLVFSQFTGFLSLVRARLAAEGIAHCYLDGRTRDRPRRIAEFKDGDAPVFVISLKAGGVGLTLTEADYVFVLDPWWNPAAEAQAVDRTHRIGQDKTVMVYRLVAKDTIEEKVVALQQRKRDLFARVVDEGAMLGTQLSADDIRGLFDA